MCRDCLARRHAVDNINPLEHTLGRGLPALLRAASSPLVPTKPTQRDTHHLHRRFMWMLLVLAAVHWGCVFPSAARKQVVEWPDPDSTPLVGAPMEAGAALAAAAAVREMVKENTSPRLFRGCSSPEQGLDVAIFKDPKTGLYYVVLHQRFDRCGGRVVRVLDGWYEYAVTAQGEVLGKAPATHLAAPTFRPPSPVLPEPTPPPAAPPPATDAGKSEPTPASAPPSQPEASTPAPTPSPVSAPSPAPTVAPSPASPPVNSPAPETPGQVHES
jgi:hypothetical protein